MERPDDLATALAAVVQADQRDTALEATPEKTVGPDQDPEASHPGCRAAREPTEPGPAYDTLERRSAAAVQMRKAGLSE